MKKRVLAILLALAMVAALLPVAALAVEPVEPGETVTMDMYVQMPKDPGQYILRLSLVQEGVLWFYIVGGGYMDMNYIVT